MREVLRKVRSLLRIWLRSPNVSEIELVRRIAAAEDGAGVMIDVGAHHGDSLGLFAARGWTVHAFEPDPGNRERLTESVGSLPNVRIDERAVSDGSQKEAVFYRSPVSTGISGLSAFHASHRPESVVEVTTLAEYAAEQGVEEIDVLKIDAEGFDLHVLRGLNWARHSPRVVLCEFEDRKTVPLGYTCHDLAGFLVERGYSILVSEWEPIVAYGREHRWRRFAPYPMELHDDKGWGNIVATRSETDWKRLRRLSRRWQWRVRIHRALVWPWTRLNAQRSAGGKDGED